MGIYISEINMPDEGNKLVLQIFPNGEVYDEDGIRLGITNWGGGRVMAGITPYTEESWKRTKADKIRFMTDEKLADFLYATWKEQDEFSKDVCKRCPDTSCQPKCWLDWLRQDAEEDET